jgi:hypothetical protein
MKLKKAGQYTVLRETAVQYVFTYFLRFYVIHNFVHGKGPKCA